jgi:type II secretory pathway component PulK
MVSRIALVVLAVIAVQLASASRAHNGFFQALSEQQKEQVSTILNGGLTKAEIREQLRHWVSSQPKETQVILITLTNRFSSL